MALRICAAAFLAGGILLAFEVVWFRFLHLFVHGGPLSFALMLGVVLSGIGTGGFVAGAIVRRRPEADRHTALLALVAGVTCVATYQASEFVIEPFGTMYLRNPWRILGLSIALALPTARSSAGNGRWVSNNAR